MFTGELKQMKAHEVEYEVQIVFYGLYTDVRGREVRIEKDSGSERSLTCNV